MTSLIDQLDTKTIPAIGSDINNAARFQSKTLNDIIAHEPPGASGLFSDGVSIATWGHEAYHMLNTKLALDNNCFASAYAFNCGFYVSQGKFITLENPDVVRISDCVPYISKNMRVASVRFHNYFENAENNKNHPAHKSTNYILEEWSAFLTGTTVAVESVAADTWFGDWNESEKGGRGYVNVWQGPSEFAIYYAGCMAAFLEKEPAHLEQPNIKTFLQLQFERSFGLYWRTRDIRSPNEFNRNMGIENEQLAWFLAEDDAAPAREALKTVFGAEWFNRVVLDESGTFNGPTVGGDVPVVPRAAPGPGSPDTPAGNPIPGSGVPVPKRKPDIPQPPKEIPTGPIPTGGAPGAGPDNKFTPDGISWHGLGITDAVGPFGGGFDTVPVSPAGVLQATPYSSDTCFPAVALASGVTITHGACRAEKQGMAPLVGGEVVQVQGLGRIWDDECGWGFLADVTAANGRAGWVRASALHIFELPSAIQDCSAPVYGQVPKGGRLAYREETTTLESSASSAITSLLLVALIMILSI